MINFHHKTGDQKTKKLEKHPRKIYHNAFELSFHWHLYTRNTNFVMVIRVINVKREPSVLWLLNISAWLCTFSDGWRGETNHATCLNRTFLNQNNWLVVYHFTVLRQFEHSHFSPPTVTACIIKRWWNHLSGFDGSCCLGPGGQGFFFLSLAQTTIRRRLCLFTWSKRTPTFNT